MYGRKPVNKENVLEKVTSYDIFARYVSPFKKVGKHFCSELRKDHNPTCVIGKVGNKLIYRDFSESETRDCFNYIMLKYGVGFQEALEMINLDFKLGLIPVKNITYTPTVTSISNFNIDDIERLPADIRVTVRNWTRSDKPFWNGKYGITSKLLSKFRVYPLTGYWINGRYFKCGLNSYGFYFGKLEDGRESWKIYQPYEKKKNEGGHKFITNCPDFFIQGYDLLPETGDLLIITKSYKDVIVLDMIEVPSISPNSESVYVDPNVIAELKLRFKDIWILYDNDETGIRGAEKLSEENNLPYFFMPIDTKDPSDFLELYGIETLREYIDGRDQWREEYLSSNNSKVGE